MIIISQTLKLRKRFLYFIKVYFYENLKKISEIQDFTDLY